LQIFAHRAVARLLSQPQAVERALGEVLTEPKPRVWFDARESSEHDHSSGVVLAAATRMAYDAHHLFINGASFLASGRDARLMCALADARQMSAADRLRLSAPAAELLQDWMDSGWLLPQQGG
jgi:50S ribosomal protein L16 3-hydroxylase